MTRAVGIALTTLMLLGACTGGGSTTADESSTTSAASSSTSTSSTSTSTSTTIPSVPAPGLAGQVAVLAIDGLHVRNTDGSGDVLIAGVDAQPAAPAFSDDGRLLAWSQFSLDGQFELATARLDDPDTINTVAAPFAGFYLSWSPDASRIAFLGIASGGVGLAVAEIEDGMPVAALGVAIDQPFYVSWGSSSEEFLTHSAAGSGIVRVDGLRRDVLAAAGPYQTPVWLPDGRMVIIESTADGSVVTLIDGDQRQTLATTPAGALLVADPTGTKLAILARGQQQSGPPVVNVAIQTIPRVRSGVAIVDLDTGSVRTVALEARTVASFSPDGLSLLTLSFADRTSGMARWDVWRDGRTIASTSFLPSGLALSRRFPFFDQFVQAGTRWAPDGSAFVFARSTADAPGGEIVRFDLLTGEETIIGPGWMALWRP